MTDKLSITLKVGGAILPYAGLLGGLFLLDSGWAAILGYHAAMCLVLTLANGWSGLRSVLEGARPVWMAVLAVIYGLGGVLIWILWPFIKLDGLELAAGLEAVGLSGGAWLAFIAYYSLVNPLLEEVYWRKLWGQDTRWPAASDFLYAGYHCFVLSLFVKWPWIVLAGSILVAAGWMWRQVARRTSGLAVPMVSHFVADASIIAAAYLLVRLGIRGG